MARTIVPLQLAAGEGCSYEWKGHGLRLTVPADALEPLGHYYDLPWQPQLLRIEQPEVKSESGDVRRVNSESGDMRRVNSESGDVRRVKSESDDVRRVKSEPGDVGMT